MVLYHSIAIGVISYPMVNKLVDPENDQFLVVSLIFQPPSARVYVHLLEGNI